VKTVHGPEAHVTKKQRSDLPPSRPVPPKENGENETGRGTEEKMDSTSRGMEDYLQVKSIKTEKSVVRDHLVKERSFGVEVEIQFGKHRPFLGYRTVMCARPIYGLATL
jgi:hypothetical protein